MYKDAAGVMYNTRAVEVYQPWSDTWFKLPTLPTFTVDGTQYNITEAHIFSILTPDSYILQLVGGVNYDINIGELLPTKHIYYLLYNGTYHWNHDSAIVPDMGK